MIYQLSLISCYRCHQRHIVYTPLQIILIKDSFIQNSIQSVNNRWVYKMQFLIFALGIKFTLFLPTRIRH